MANTHKRYAPKRDKGAAEARRKKQKRSARRPAHSLIEGKRAVFEALEARVPLSGVFMTANYMHDSSLSLLADRLEKNGVPIECVSKPILDRMSDRGAHQGVIAKACAFDYASLESVVSRAQKETEIVLLLDHITDEGNFGAIIRSAECVGAAGVIIPKARSARVGPAVYKTSAGAVLHTRIAQVPNLVRAAQHLKEAGFWLVGASERAQQTVWETPFEGRIALVVGSEGAGISRLMLEACDFTCKLPQRGSIASLNVAQATTALCYEWLRRNCVAKVSTPIRAAVQAQQSVEA